MRADQRSLRVWSDSVERHEGAVLMTDLMWAFAGTVGLFLLMFFVLASGLQASIGGAVLFLVLSLLVALHRRRRARKQTD